jgi:hypothetical protein
MKENTKKIKHTPVGQIIMEVASHFQLYGYHFNDNEANIRAEIVDPIIKALGWRMDNNTLYREVKCKSSAQRVDYALFKDNVCRFIIEVKSLNTFLKEGERKQLMKYLQDPRFATAKYNFAAREFCEEYLYDDKGNVMFIYVLTPDVELNMSSAYELRMWFDGDRLLRFMAKKAEGLDYIDIPSLRKAKFTEVYSGTAIPELYQDETNRCKQRAERFLAMFKGIDENTYL